MISKKYNPNKKTRSQLKYRDAISAYIGLEPLFADVYPQYPNTRRVKYSIELGEEGVEYLQRINEIYKMSEAEFLIKFGFSKKKIKFPGNGFCRFEKDDYTDRNADVFGRSSRRVNGEFTMNKNCNTNISIWFEASVLQPLKYDAIRYTNSFKFCKTTKWKTDQKYINKYSVESIKLGFDEAWNKISNTIENLDVDEFKPITTTQHKALDLYINNKVRLLISCDFVSAKLQEALWDAGVGAYSHRQLIGVKDCVAFISNRKGVETTQITLVETNDAIEEYKFHNFKYNEIDSAILGEDSMKRILQLIEVVKQFS